MTTQVALQNLFTEKLNLLKVPNALRERIKKELNSPVIKELSCKSFLFFFKKYSYTTDFVFDYNVFGEPSLISKEVQREYANAEVVDDVVMKKCDFSSINSSMNALYTPTKLKVVSHTKTTVTTSSGTKSYYTLVLEITPKK